MGPREIVAVVAEQQHGAAGVGQLGVAGVSRQQVRTLLARGDVIAAGRGVLVVAGSPDTWERRLWVGLLTLGPRALVSHEAAAALHRLDRCRPEPLEFLVPRGQRHRSGAARVHSSRTLQPTDRVSLRGLPCTSATRTLLDLAVAGIDRVRLEAAIDSAVRLGVTSPVALGRRLRALQPGDHTASLLDRVLPDSGGHSILERRFLALVRRAGLPRPATQVVHRAGSRTVARVDFLWEPAALVVEVSGRLGHATDLEREQQATRRDELEELGLRVKELSYHQVVHQPADSERRLRAWLGPAGVAAGHGLG